MLNVGTKAPDFTLPDDNGNMVSLSDFLGKKVILYFYPKDNTTGCTKQALRFKEYYDTIRTDDVVVIGISKDSVKSHKSFQTKYELPFVMLSDTELTVIKAYECWALKKLYGREYMGVNRNTYVIDEKGIIIKAFEKVKPDFEVKNYVE